MLDTNHCLHIDAPSFEDQPTRNDHDKQPRQLDYDRHAYHSLKEGGPEISLGTSTLFKADVASGLSVNNAISECLCFFVILTVLRHFA